MARTRRRRSHRRSGRGSAWRALVKKELKRGGTFKSASRKWRKGHKVAANYGTKCGFRKAARRHRKTSHRWAQTIGKIGGIKRWHRKSARRHTRKHTHRRRIAANMGIIPWIASNRRRRYSRNPGGFGAFKASFKELLSLETLIEAATVSGGSLIAVGAPNLLIAYATKADGTSFIPAIIRTGWGKYLLNLTATAVASGIAGWFGKTKIARNLLIGGIAGTLTEVVTKEVLPKAAPALAAKAGLSGMGILTADVESAVEQAVQEELAKQGMSDYLVPSEAANPMLADYLVPAEVQGMGIETAQVML